MRALPTFLFTHKLFTILLSCNINIVELIHMWKKFSYVQVEEAHRILMKAARVEVRREMVPIHEAYDLVLGRDLKKGETVQNWAHLTCSRH